MQDASLFLGILMEQLMDDAQVDNLTKDEMEPLLSKIVDWVHKHNRVVEELTRDEIVEAILSRVRNT